VALGAAVWLGAAALAAQSAEAPGAVAVRVEVSVAARVVPGLGIQKTRDLDIGEVRSGTSPGSVRVEVLPGAATLRSAAGGVALSGSSYFAAQFSVTTSGGPAASRLQVSLPAFATLSRIGGRETMTVGDFRASLAPSCTSGPDCAGAPYVLLVGATLSVGADQAAGRYAGTFTVTVNQF
jgi:hypothetical protein